jgi:hypothetical protein
VGSGRNKAIKNLIRMKKTVAISLQAHYTKSRPVE